MMPAWLEEKLRDFSLKDIYDFSAWTAEFLDRADDRRIAIASAIIRGIPGVDADDGWLYFRCWLIAQGEQIYKVTVQNPDSLADVPDIEKEAELGGGLELEILMYVTLKPFEEKSGGRKFQEAMPEWQPPPGCQPYNLGQKNPDFWHDKDITKLSTLYPRLTKRFPLHT